MTAVRDWPADSLMLSYSVSLASACRTPPSTSFDSAASYEHCASALMTLQGTDHPPVLSQQSTIHQQTGNRVFLKMQRLAVDVYDHY